MTPEQFVYWLQGYFELTELGSFTKREQIIKDHLKEVFHKKTPNYTSTPNQSRQIPPMTFIPQIQTTPNFPPNQPNIIC